MGSHLSKLSRLLLESLPAKNLDSLATLYAVALRLIDRPEYSRIFSFKKECYGRRGGLPYFKPRGWVRFSVDAPEDILRNWCVAYHGTDWPTAARILRQGLRNPDAKDVQVAHGQAGSVTRKSIYLTPAVGYAAFPVYSAFHQVAAQHWIQCVIQVRVRPGSFSKRSGTLGNKYWPSNLCFDEDVRSLCDLEWLIENPDDHVVCGVLVREFGPDADGDIYGELTTRVVYGEHGPEYEWIDLLEKKFRKKKLFLK